MKGNLEHSALPDQEEIRKYQNGELDPARSHEIELIAEENPLLADAIEGYAANPAYHLLPGITAAVTTAAGVTATTGLTAGTVAGAVKAASPWWHLNGWLIGATVGTSAAVGTYFISESISESKKKNGQDLAEYAGMQNDIKDNEGSMMNYSDAADSLANHDETIAPEEVMNVQTASGGIQNVDGPKAALNSGEPGSEVKADRGESLPVKISTKKSNVIASGRNGQGNDLPKNSSTVAIQIMKVLNYKMADYTAIRDNTWEKFDVDDLGLPAKWKSESEKEEYLRDHPDRFTPYIDYITTCISAFDQEKYETAIQRFSVVLDQYPDDVNALFYSAMSEFHLMRYNSAIAFFKQVEKNMIRTFNEESFFYHAMCLKSLGDVDGANSHFVKVIKLNGFYRERAIEEMQ